MDARAMDPHGSALRAFFEGDATAELVLVRDDGLASPIPAGYFFREPSAFSKIERAAIDRCRGHVLDVGAGTGLHSLALQALGRRVTAIDVSPQCVAIMVARGVGTAECANVFDYRGGLFDTLLLMGHGVGMVETLAGLDRFLPRAGELLAVGGQVLLDSLDVRAATDPGNLAYLEANRAAGRYVGEIRLYGELRGVRGPAFGWLMVDPETLADHAARAGWQCEVVVAREAGDYLARLTRASDP